PFDKSLSKQRSIVWSCAFPVPRSHAQNSLCLQRFSYTHSRFAKTTVCVRDRWLAAAVEMPSRAASQHGARRKHLSGGRALGAKKRSGPNSLHQPGYEPGVPMNAVEISGFWRGRGDECGESIVAVLRLPPLLCDDDAKCILPLIRFGSTRFL